MTKGRPITKLFDNNKLKLLHKKKMSKKWEMCQGL